MIFIGIGIGIGIGIEIENPIFRPPDLWENAVRPVSPRGGPDEPVDEPQFGPRVGRRRGVEFL